ncbi:MAG: NAD(P)/FAD-dependent oxidoreductase [Gammaproteobacteria bacterium]
MHTVIIGSGIAGVTFAEKFRSLNGEAGITLITRETDGYYSRPLLSRGFSKETIEQSIILKTFDALRESNIDVICGTEITAIRRSDRSVDLNASGGTKSLTYDKLVIAQGSAAFIPPPLRPYRELFFCLNSLADLKELRKFRQGLINRNRKPEWAIIGGGLIGCEVASDLAVSGDKVTLFHVMDRLMERQLAADDSALLLETLKDSGVDVLLNQSVHSIARQNNKICISNDTATEFDGVIVACGFMPRTGLAEQAGLDVGRGIKVDVCLKTSDSDIFALGDVAELPNGKLYAYILPIRNQAFWLAGHMSGQESQGWTPPVFTTKAKVHGFEAAHPYNL